MRAMIMYLHCSPHQVVAVEAARKAFAEQHHELIPVEYYYAATEYTWTLNDKHRPDSWHCLYPERKIVNNFRLFSDIRKKIKELRIDVLVINGWYGLFAWWLIFLKRWIGVRIVLVSDSNYFDKPRTWITEVPKKLLLRSVDAGFVAGTPQAEYLQKLGLLPEQMTFGADVVDNSLYTSIERQDRLLDRKIVIGTAARLIEKKNLAAAMRALNSVRLSHPELSIEWQIAGQGPLESSLKQLAAELQLPVVFLGFVGYTKMPGFFEKLDLYWQPSSSEPWGLAVNEGMAAGLPILASDRCGCACDLVTASTGWRHPISHTGMVGGLEMALADRESWPKRGKAARDLIMQWDVDRYSEGLIQACQIAFHGNR